MYKKIMLTAVLIAVTTTANAWNIENFAALDPDVIVKGNVGNDSDGLTTGLTVALETNLCNRYKHCFNPFLININNENGSNTGLGIDYVYKIWKSRSYAKPYDTPGDNVFIMLGGALFIEPLNHIDGEYNNLHVGIGAEINRVIVSLDAYGRPDSNNEHAESEIMVNVGYRF